MPRQARLNIAGMPVHAVQRGVDKQAVFRCDRDKRVYLGLLDELGGRHDCAVHAYVLMTNHVHLLMTPGTSHGVASLMKHLGQRFVQYVNWCHRRTGHLFEGRYKCCMVDSGSYFLACQRYIELNPVRAGMVAHPGEYPWSSYGSNAEGKPSDILVPHGEYLALAAEPQARRSVYRRLFGECLSEGQLGRIRESLNAGSVLADDRSLAVLEREHGARVRVRPRGRPSDGDARSSYRKMGTDPNQAASSTLSADSGRPSFQGKSTG